MNWTLVWPTVGGSGQRESETRSLVQKGLKKPVQTRHCYSLSIPTFFPVHFPCFELPPSLLIQVIKSIYSLLLAMSFRREYSERCNAQVASNPLASSYYRKIARIHKGVNDTKLKHPINNRLAGGSNGTIHSALLLETNTLATTKRRRMLLVVRSKAVKSPRNIRPLVEARGR